MNAEPLRISAKAKSVAAVMTVIVAILAAAFSVSVCSSLPVGAHILSAGTPPVTTLEITNGTMNLTAAQNQTTPDDDDNVSGIWYSLDVWNTTSNAWDIGDWTNYTAAGGVNVTLPQGTVRINYNATDIGQENEITNTTIEEIDTVAPTASAAITSGTAASAGWYKSNVTVLISTTNDTIVAGYHRNSSGLNSTSYKIGTGSTVTTIIHNETERLAGVNMTVSAQGVNNVTYWSSDNATNKVAKNILVKIDSVAPTLTLPTDGSTLTALWFNWTGADASSGIAKYTVSIDGAAAVNNTNGSIKLTGGSHNVTVTAIDVAGNSVSKSVTVTATAPAGGIDMMLIIIIVVVIVVVIAVVAVMMMKKGKKGAVAEEAPAAEEKS